MFVSSLFCCLSFFNIGPVLIVNLNSSVFSQAMLEETLTKNLHLQQDLENMSQVREGVNWKKKNVFFRALPELPKPPPPPWPQFGQLGPLFSEVEIQDLKVSLELKILYILYNILYICNLKNS